MSLANQLDSLESLGLLQMVQEEPDLEYSFRQALVQEVAYSSLVKQDRQRLHLAVAEAIEKLYPDRLEKLAPILGHHFFEAGEDARALKYFIAAGDSAVRVYANAEAALHYSHALEIAQRLPDLEDPTQVLIDLFTNLGRALEKSGNFIDALGNYLEMEYLAKERGDRKLELAALVARATIHAIPSPVLDTNRGHSLSEQALELANELGDRQAKAKILWNLLLLNFFLNRIEEARKCGEQSLEIARQLDMPEQLAFTLNDLGGFIYTPTGQFEAGLWVLEEARMIWKEIGNLPMLADNLSNTAFIHFFMGHFEEALNDASNAYQISQTAGSLWGQAYSRIMSGAVHGERGEVDQSIQDLEEAVSMGEQSGFLAGRAIARSYLAYLYSYLGDLSKADEQARDAVRIASEHAPFWLVQALGSQAYIQTLMGNISEAESTIQQAYEKKNEIGGFLYVTHVFLSDLPLCLARGDAEGVVHKAAEFVVNLKTHTTNTYLPYALYYQSRALLILNRVDEASRILTEAEQVARSLPSRHCLWRILAARAEVERRQGRRLAERAYRRQAKEVIDTIAETISSVNLRSSFFQLPQVQRLYIKKRYPRKKK